MLQDPAFYVVAFVIVVAVGIAIVFGLLVHEALKAPPYDSAAEWRKMKRTLDEGIVMLERLRHEHARWQRNYEAGRYWGDDGDGKGDATLPR